MDADIRATTNQAPLLAGHNVVTSDAALVEAVTRHAGRRRRRGPGRAGRGGGHRGGPGARHAGQPAPPRAHDVRPLRQPHRRGRVPPVLALADGARGGPRPAGGALGAAGGGQRARARTAGRGVLRLVADRARPRLPDLDDVRRGAGAAGRRGPRQGVGAAAGRPVLRPRCPGRLDQARRAGRDGDDREAGRLRRPRQRHRGAHLRRGRRVHPARAQVVHLGADERHLPGAGPGRGRGDLLRGAAGAAERRPQPPRRGPPQGQARQPLQRLLRAGAGRHLGPAAGRRGPRRAHHHRDGRGHPAGLRARARRR